MKRDTLATAPQKVWETVGPISELPGTSGLLVRVASIQLNGVCQTFFVFGPCGPLLKPAPRCPQCPS